MSDESYSEDMSASDDESSIKRSNLTTVLHQAQSIKRQTLQAMKDGFYPIVIGGDKTQCLDTISAMKEHEPNTKLLWVDSYGSSDQAKDESYRTLDYLLGR